MSDTELAFRTTLDASGFASGAQTLNSHLSTLGIQTNTASANLGGLGTILGTIANPATAVALGFTAIGGAISSSVGVAASFQQQMAGVAAIVSDSSKSAEENAQVQQQLTDAAREAGATTQFSASQAAEALGYMAGAGWSADQATAGLKDTLTLASAGSMDLAQAGDLMTNTVAQFGLQATDASRISNVLAAGASATNTSVSDLGGGLKQAGTLANTFGISLEATTAALGTLSNSGLKGAESGTALRGVLASLANQSGPAAEELGKMGLKADDINPSMHSLGEVFGTLRDRGMTASQALKIFGSEGASSASYLAQYADTLAPLETSITGTDKATQMAAITTATYNGAMGNLSSAMEDAQIALGDAFLPSVTSGINILTTGVGYVTQFGEAIYDVAANSTIAESMGTTITSVGNAVGAVFENLTSVVGPAWDAIGGGSEPIDLLSTSFEVLTAPLNLTITGIGLLADGIIAFEQAAAPVADMIGQGIGGAISTINGLLGIDTDTSKTSGDQAATDIATGIKENKDLQTATGDTLGSEDSKKATKDAAKDAGKSAADAYVEAYGSGLSAGMQVLNGKWVSQQGHGGEKDTTSTKIEQGSELSIEWYAQSTGTQAHLYINGADAGSYGYYKLGTAKEVIISDLLRKNGLDGGLLDTGNVLDLKGNTAAADVWRIENSATADVTFDYKGIASSYGQQFADRLENEGSVVAKIGSEKAQDAYKLLLENIKDPMLEDLGSMLDEISTLSAERPLAASEYSLFGETYKKKLISEIADFRELAKQEKTNVGDSLEDIFSDVTVTDEEHDSMLGLKSALDFIKTESPEAFEEAGLDSYDAFFQAVKEGATSEELYKIWQDMAEKTSDVILNKTLALKTKYEDIGSTISDDLKDGILTGTTQETAVELANAYVKMGGDASDKLIAAIEAKDWAEVGRILGTKTGNGFAEALGMNMQNAVDSFDWTKLLDPDLTKELGYGFDAFAKNVFQEGELLKNAADNLELWNTGLPENREQVKQNIQVYIDLYNANKLLYTVEDRAAIQAYMDKQIDESNLLKELATDTEKVASKTADLADEEDDACEACNGLISAFGAWQEKTNQLWSESGGYVGTSYGIEYDWHMADKVANQVIQEVAQQKQLAAAKGQTLALTDEEQLKLTYAIMVHDQYSDATARDADTLNMFNQLMSGSAAQADTTTASMQSLSEAMASFDNKSMGTVTKTISFQEDTSGLVSNDVEAKLGLNTEPALQDFYDLKSVLEGETITAKLSSESSKESTSTGSSQSIASAISGQSRYLSQINGYASRLLTTTTSMSRNLYTAITNDTEQTLAQISTSASNISTAISSAATSINSTIMSAAWEIIDALGSVGGGGGGSSSYGSTSYSDADNTGGYWTGAGNYSGSFYYFSNGGYADRATLAIVGDSPGGEYMVPAQKLESFLAEAISARSASVGLSIDSSNLTSQLAEAVKNISMPVLSVPLQIEFDTEAIREVIETQLTEAISNIKLRR